MSTIVVALGGNALGECVDEQLSHVRVAATAIADLIEAGHRIVVVHGNGPQVGIIKNNFDMAECDMPIAECTAMSQGYIGYHLQQALRNELRLRNLSSPVVTLLSQVTVNKTDAAFKNPTKPIGRFYDDQTALKLMSETGRTYIDDSGRGWRWVVPSPPPLDICEKQTIKLLLESGQTVIACGGGGVPVTIENGDFKGVDVVIDKDYAAGKLAELINADILLILTAIDQVCINYGKPNQKSLKRLSTTQARQYIEEQHFAPGSMLPKVHAGVSFADSKPGRKSIIGSLANASRILHGESGTEIYCEIS